MNVKKLNLRKIGLLLVVSVGLLTMSCEKEELEIESTEAVEEQKKPEVEPVTINYKYNYNGEVFTEEEWENKLSSMNTTDFSFIGLNDALYVFDDESKASLFENGDLQVLIDDVNDTQSLNTEDTVLATGTVTFKIELYKDINYSGYKYTIYQTHTVRRMQTSWGYAYLENNEFQANLPSSIDEEASSYKMTLVRNASVLSNGVTLRMYGKLRLGRLSDGGAEWEKFLAYNNSSHQDNDFRNNRIWGVFGLVTWNDRIRSWNVEFR